MPLPLLALMLAVFGFTTGEFVVAGILPQVAGDLSVSVAAAGLLATAYAVGMIIGGPLVTVLTARLPRKGLVIGLIVVSIAGNLASALAPSYPLLLGARLVAGLVVATFFAVAIATAAGMAPPARQASSVAKVTLGMNLGIVLGAPIGTFVGQELGWRATFGLLAACIVVALLLVGWFLPRQRPVAAASVAGELRVLADRDVQLAIALTAVGNVGVVTTFLFIAPLLTTVSGFGAGAVPTLLLVYGAGAVVGNFLGGWLADRALLPALVGLLGVLAGLLAVFWLVSPSQVLAGLGTFGLGVLAFAILPGMQTRVVTAASAAPTLAVAVNASGFQVAAAFAGWLGGQVIGSPLGVRAVPLVGAVFTVAGLGIAWVALRRARRSAASVPATAR